MVTTNVWPPDDIAGVRNVIWESVTVRSVTCWLPRVTVAATLFEPRKLAPVTVTRVPPVFGPRFGVEDATSGVRTGGPYVKPAVTVADALPDDGVTLRSTSPSAAPAGTVAVISVELLRTTSVAARVPKVTVGVPASPNPEPVMVIVTPPSIRVAFGVNDVIVGAT